MTTQVIDIAVFGSGPDAMLLAGLLARRHARKVALIRRKPFAGQIPPTLDLAAAVMTRPESWAALRHGADDIVRLLGEMGASLSAERVEAHFGASGPEATEALKHRRQVAAGGGWAVQREVADGKGPDRYAIRLSDVIRLSRRPLLTALETWAVDAGVVLLEAARCACRILKNGNARITHDGAAISADLAVLADPEALRTYLPPAEFDRHFQLVRGATLLSEPTAALRVPVMVHADSGMIATQSAAGAIAISGAGSADMVISAAARQWPEIVGVRLAGQAITHRCLHRDGGPVFGNVGQSGAWCLAGLGPASIFFMPAVAQQIAGVSETEGNTYFLARATGRRRAPCAAEFVPLAIEGVAT